MLIFRHAAACRVVSLREIVLLQSCERGFDRFFSQTHHRFAIAQLIAGIHDCIQREGVHVGREGGFFGEHTEHARFKW